LVTIHAAPRHERSFGGQWTDIRRQHLAHV
jgi:hypothetical protein